MMINPLIEINNDVRRPILSVIFPIMAAENMYAMPYALPKNPITHGATPKSVPLNTQATIINESKKSPEKLKKNKG